MALGSRGPRRILAGLYRGCIQTSMSLHLIPGVQRPSDQVNSWLGVHHKFLKKMELIINCYITLAIALTAIILFIWAWANLKRGLRTRHWIRVDGDVVSSSVKQSGTTIEFDHPTYQIGANVEYKVNGMIYRTSRSNDFVGSLSSIGKPKALQKKSTVPVYYNPKNPQEAVIERAALHFGIVLGLLGIGFIALEWHWVGKTFF